MAKIGIFDSGIGGLSILKEIHALGLGNDIYYIADSLHNPYGLKDKDFVVKRSIELTEMLISFDVDLIVIACNTATALVIDELREKFDIPFVGVEPYVNVINQREDLSSKKGLILTTPLMGESKRFVNLKNRLDPNGVLDHFSPPNLATIIEENFFGPHDFHDDIKSELSSVLNYDYYILGCTHYPLIEKVFNDIVDAELISGCKSVAKRVHSILESQNNAACPHKQTFNFLKTDEDNEFKTLNYSNIF